MSAWPTVLEIMHRDFAHADPDESLASVRQTMRLGRLRHLMVARNDALLGLLSYRDVLELFSAPDASALEHARVADLMQPTPTTIRTQASVAEAADPMYRYGLGCLPVVDEGGRLVGLVTERDLLRVAFDKRPRA